jgi:hypothetical protein
MRHGPAVAEVKRTARNRASSQRGALLVAMLAARFPAAPDGRHIAFVVSAPPSYGAVVDGCSPVVVVPSDGQNVLVDGLNDPDSNRFFITTPTSGARTALRSCHANLSWLPES